MQLSLRSRQIFCPNQCPVDTEYEPLKTYLNQSSLGKEYTVWDGWSPDLQNGKVKCDLCEHRWLFIVEAGDAKRTSQGDAAQLLHVLGLHPAMSLVELEPGPLHFAIDLWMRAATQQYHLRSWQRKPPHPGHLMCDLHRLFLDVVAPRTKHADPIVGFRLMRWDSVRSLEKEHTLAPQPERNNPVLMLRFAEMLFPCSRFIINLRHQDLQQEKRGGLKQDSVDLERMSKLLNTSKQSLEHHPSEDWLQTERLMDSLELERFAKSLPAWRSYVFFRDERRNIYAYNKLLHWLGETNCQYEWLANNESFSMNVSLTHGHEIAVTGGCRL